MHKKLTANKIFAFSFFILVLLFILYKLLLGGINFVRINTGNITPIHYTVEDFELVGIEYVDSHCIINATDDPQLIMNDIHTPLKNVWLDATFSYDPGEIVLFYTTKEGEPYSDSQRVYAQWQNGMYYFDLAGTGAQNIRIDTGVYPSITVDINSITFNQYTTAAQVFELRTPQLFTYIIISLFCSAALSICFDIYTFVRQQKNKQYIKKKPSLGHPP